MIDKIVHKEVKKMNEATIKAKEAQVVEISEKIEKAQSIIFLEMCIRDRRDTARVSRDFGICCRCCGSL